jgi:hypothetical protein
MSITHVWELSGSWVRGEDLRLPDTSIDISVHVLGGCEAYRGGAWSRLPRRLVVGSLTRAVRLRHQGPLHAFSIRLPPGGAHLLGIPPASLRDTLCALSDVTPWLDAVLRTLTLKESWITTTPLV